MSDFTDERIAKARARCEAATDAPWFWESVGEKSNSAYLGTVFDDEGNPPNDKGGKVICDPYSEETGDYEYDKYVFDEYICGKDDHARFVDFDFIAHARTDLPDALDALVEARRERDELKVEVNKLSQIVNNRWKP